MWSNVNSINSAIEKNVVRKFILVILTLHLSVLQVACSDGKPNSVNSMHKVLRISSLPDHNQEVLKETYQPLLDYLKNKTGLNTELVIANSYPHLLELFNSNKIDLANFGGVTYIKAHQKNNATPLILRDVDEKFSSVVLVRKEASARRLEDLLNRSFAFGSRLSTSGHLMPRHYFMLKNIQVESFFASVKYSGAHDETAYWVQHNKVYAGVANASIIHQMYRDGRLKASEVRILWETPAYPDYVWAMRSDVAKEVQIKVRDAFLELNLNNPEQKKILDKLGAAYYMPASHDQFATLENIMAELSDKGVLE